LEEIKVSFKEFNEDKARRMVIKGDPCSTNLPTSFLSLIPHIVTTNCQFGYQPPNIYDACF